MKNNKIKLLNKQEIENFFAILAQNIKPIPELHYQSELDLLIAVVLSAQTTDKQVNKVTAELWKNCRSAEDYIALGEEGISEAIKSIGLFRNKAKSIFGLCTKIINTFDGKVPNNFDDLVSLPGVGRKTANVVLNIIFKQPTLAVDTHVFRISNRVGLVNQPTPEKTELALLKIIPKKYLQDAHHYLILHGRYQCVARSPKCTTCCVANTCHYPEKNLNNE